MAAASAADWVRVERRPGGYALVVLCRKPVNTMNLAFWKRLTEVLDELESDPEVRQGSPLAAACAASTVPPANATSQQHLPLPSTRCAAPSSAAA